MMYAGRVPSIPVGVPVCQGRLGPSNERLKQQFDDYGIARGVCNVAVLYRQVRLGPAPSDDSG